MMDISTITTFLSQLDHIIETHPAYKWVKSEADKRY